MHRHLSFIVKNCWRNRRRTILTILSVGVSLSLLGVLMAIYHAFYFAEVTGWQAKRLVTRNKVSLALPLPQHYREKIKKIPGVREVYIEQWFGGQYIDSRPEHFFARMAVEPDRIFTVFPDILMPEDQIRAFQKQRTAFISGVDLARKQGWKLGDKITLKGDIFPIDLELTLRGIFTSPENAFAQDAMFFNREYLEQAIPVGRRGNAGDFVFLAEDINEIPRIETEVDDMFRNSPVQTKTDTLSAFALSFLALLGNVKLFLLSICAAVTFTILLVSGNTISMSVRERVKEVGILKTLGFTRGAILQIILGESILLSVTGGVLGLLIASSLTAMVRKQSALAAQLKTLTIVPSVAAACLGVAAMIGLVSAFIPAYNASRISIVEALKRSD
jgi:putative ABC transport system permease protein